jgi:hypothetical protein
VCDNTGKHTDKNGLSNTTSRFTRFQIISAN